MMLRDSIATVIKDLEARYSKEHNEISKEITVKRKDFLLGKCAVSALIIHRLKVALAKEATNEIRSNPM